MAPIEIKGRALEYLIAHIKTRGAFNIYAIRVSDDSPAGTVKIKINEGMWSAPISTEGTPDA